MWKLLRFLKPYRKESICAPLFKLLEVVFELLVPLVVAHMIDSGIGGADKGIIVRSVLLMITLGAVGLASATTAQYFAAKASAGFGANIRYAMMQHIQKRSYAELDQMGTNTVLPVMLIRCRVVSIWHCVWSCGRRLSSLGQW